MKRRIELEPDLNLYHGQVDICTAIGKPFRNEIFSCELDSVLVWHVILYLSDGVSHMPFGFDGGGFRRAARIQERRILLHLLYVRIEMDYGMTAFSRSYLLAC